MDDHPCSLDLSSKREKNAQRREIFRLLDQVREIWQAEPDLSVRREEYVDRIKQVLKQKGRKV